MTDQLAFTWPGTEGQLSMVNDREQIRDMELRTYDCPTRGHHPAHPYDHAGSQVHCSGLVSEPCGAEGNHPHHRWAKPEEFFWCDGRPHHVH